MNRHAHKTQENKSKVDSRNVFQKQSKEDHTAPFADNRPEAIAQRKRQELVNNSPQVRQLRIIQAMANNRMEPTVQMKGKVNINDDVGLEREADVMGLKALSTTSTQRKNKVNATSLKHVQRGNVVQRGIDRSGKGGKRGGRKTGRKQIGAGRAKRRDFRQKEVIEIKLTAPNSLIMLKVRLPNEIKNYADWLNNPANWAGRSQETMQRHAAALSKLNEAKAELTALKGDFPQSIYGKWTRTKTREFQERYDGAIKAGILSIRGKFVEIDELVKEPPVPPKDFGAFKGNRRKMQDYHTGAAGDPIPIVFYKRETEYKPIRYKRKNYNFPNGPTVWGRLGKYILKVAPGNRFRVGTVLRNQKNQNSRKVQVDINHGLTSGGTSMAGLDGDHVKDLGFDGRDRANNYWPLKASINRRPFLGWRKNYGINYKLPDGTGRTVALGALYGKYFKIKKFMPAGGGNVPVEGVRPMAKSGTKKV